MVKTRRRDASSSLSLLLEHEWKIVSGLAMSRQAEPEGRAGSQRPPSPLPFRPPMHRATFAIRANRELLSFRQFSQAAPQSGETAKTQILHKNKKMTIPLTRCQFLIPFADICDEIGAPTEALLSKLRLPVSLEEKADHYIPIQLAIRFAEVAQRSQGITDIGFLAARRLQFRHLSERCAPSIRFSPTLFIALQQLCKWASLEDTNVSAWLERDADRVRICKSAGTSHVPHLENSQWLQNVMSMHIVRQFAGPNWVPATMAFGARYEPSLETRSFWQNTRFISDQNSSWIDIPVSFLDLPNLASETSATSHDDEAGPCGHEIVSAVKLMLPSYLDERIPTVAEIAEMAGISIRSFQRKLSSAGVSYSDLLDGARFENAAKLLRDTDAKIIDVAFLRATPILRISLALSDDFPELHRESFVANGNRNRRRSRDVSFSDAKLGFRLAYIGNFWQRMSAIGCRPD